MPCINVMQLNFKAHLWQSLCLLCLYMHTQMGYAAPEQPDASPTVSKQEQASPATDSPKVQSTSRTRRTYHVSLKRSKRENLKLVFSQTMVLKQQPPTAAVFVQRPYLWVVLDHPISTHFSQKGQVKLPEGFDPPERVSHPTHTVLRMKIPYHVLPSVNHDPEEGWSVVFGHDTTAPTGTHTTLTSRLMASLAPPVSLIIQMPHPQVVYLRSPEHGKQWIVIPEDEPGLGLPGIFRYTDFTILKSLQGLLLESITPDLSFHPQHNQLTISRPIGLRLSPMEDRVLAREKQEKRRLFEFKTWQQAEIPFPEAKANLSAKVAAAGEEDKLLAQLELAQFLLAHGNGSEAIGVLRLIAGQNYRLKEDAEFMSLLGAAYLLNKSYGKALNIFSNPLLPPEAELWKGAAMVGLGLTEQGFFRLAKHREILETYPDTLKPVFALKAIEGAITLKKQDQVQHFFNVIKKTPLTSAQENQLRDFQEAYTALLTPEASKNPFISRKTQGESAKNKAEETFHNIKRGYETKKIALDETVHHLENLRHNWRGDFVEFLVLQLLARIHGEHRNFEKSMEAYERLFAFFPQQPEILSLKKEAKEIYKQGVEVLSPAFRKIAFFYRFKKFLPKTPEQATILEKLANQLIAIGLSDQAVTILEKERSQFVETEPKYYLKLAQAYLEDNQADKALRALSSPLLNEAKFKEKDKVVYLKAQAFYEKKAYQKALSYLKNKHDLNSMALAADIYWELKAWDNVAGQIQLMLKKIGTPQPELVLRLAMALYQDKQQESLKSIGSAYGDIMQGTPYETLFQMLTSAEHEPLSTEAVFATLKQVKPFQKFSTMLKSGKI